MKFRYLTMIAFAALVLAIPAQAMDLSEARLTGAVGEKLDGYVEPLTSSSEAKALAKEINQKRKAEYERISKENGQPASVVGKLAAEKIINRLDKGAYYQNNAGDWVKR